MGYANVGFHGVEIKTPHLDRLVGGQPEKVHELTALLDKFASEAVLLILKTEHYARKLRRLVSMHQHKDSPHACASNPPPWISS